MQIKELLYKNQTEIEAWLVTPRPKPVDRALLRWLVLDCLFDRQNERCAVCNEKLGALIDMDVDHKIPRWKGGSDSMANLQLVCIGCHRRKTRTDLSKR